MTPEEKSLLERTLKMAEENNGILRSMRRASRFAMIARAAYWVVILILGFGAYYFIQPYVTSMLGLIGSSPSDMSTNYQNAQNAANELKQYFK
jgi:hypothetical protein